MSRKSYKDLLGDLRTANKLADQLKKENKEQRDLFAKVISEKDRQIDNRDEFLTVYQDRNADQNERIDTLENHVKERQSESGRNLRLSGLLFKGQEEKDMENAERGY